MNVLRQRKKASQFDTTTIFAPTPEHAREVRQKEAVIESLASSFSRNLLMPLAVNFFSLSPVSLIGLFLMSKLANVGAEEAYKFFQGKAPGYLDSCSGYGGFDRCLQGYITTGNSTEVKAVWRQAILGAGLKEGGGGPLMNFLLEQCVNSPAIESVLNNALEQGGGFGSNVTCIAESTMWQNTLVRGKFEGLTQAVCKIVQDNYKSLINDCENTGLYYKHAGIAGGIAAGVVVIVAGITLTVACMCKHSRTHCCQNSPC